jgi:ABC-2 type transport system ATP-binding protein
MSASSDSQVFVEARHLYKCFPANKADTLQDVSFSIKQGESVALVGANGAGKSTLIKIILGLVRPTKGELKIFGDEAGAPSSHARIGYLPEIPGFWGELSAFELLEDLASLRGIESSTGKKRRDKLLALLGLSKRGVRPMGGYSKGMLQRTGIASALLHDPDFLILDEPMSGLDPRAQEKLRVVIQKLRENGKTLLISSHALEDIRSFCDRVIVLERSRLVLDGPTHEVLNALVEKYRSSEPWDEDPLGELPQEGWSL